ncbi:MAG: phosphate signaling complex protein PhoU [Hyphomicrobiaceae bacterium]
MTSHTVRAYDAEFAELDRITAEMGGLAEMQLANAVEALEKRDPELAEKAIATDFRIDTLESQLQERAVVMIAKRQPMANDLRHIMTVLTVVSGLERVGDLAKNIAKRARAIASETHPRPVMAGIGHLAELAHGQLKDVLDAYSARDEEKALVVWRSDAKLDALYNSVFRELLSYMMEDPANVGLCTHLLFAAKNLERIGDHATNIAEGVYYLVTGDPLSEERPKGDDTSTILFNEPSD